MCCFKLGKKVMHFLVNIGPIKCFMDIFLNFFPLKAPAMVMFVCVGLVHLPYSESTSSETESTQNVLAFTKISLFRIDLVDVESHSVLR
jgi:hypothetical protein